MNLNKVISAFNNSSINNIKKEDLTDITKKNDAAVKTIKNIFDTNLDGQLDTSELALIDKLTKLDGNDTNGISLTDLKLLASMNGSSGDISFGDLSILKNGKYSTQNNSVNTFDLNQRKTSATTLNDDGSVVTTTYAYDKTETKIEYTGDYKMTLKTVTHTNGAEEKYQYNDSGIIIKKDETAKDGSKTATSYNNDGKTSAITKTDSDDNFVSKEEYDYDDNGKTSTITGYDSTGKETGKTLYSDDGTKIQVKYDNNGEITQRDTFNRFSKPLTSFIKNDDGSAISTAYEYQTNGDIKSTTKTTNALGLQVSERINSKHSNGSQEVYTDGILTQKDEVNTNGTIKSTVYSAENVIDSVTEKDTKGNINKIDYYSYVNGNIDTITEKDADGNITGTGKYNYNNPNQIKSLDHFDASGTLVDTSVWNLDETKTVYKYNTTLKNLTGTLIENYGTDNKITNSVLNADSGCKLSSTYTYNVPNSGDTAVNSINISDNGEITAIQDTIIHKDGTSETNVYNNDKTQLLQKDTTDKYGNETATLYENNKITSVTKTNSGGSVTATDKYNYTDGILVSVNHLNGSNKSTGTTQYDPIGNSKDFDSLGRITSSKTTNPTTGEITTEAYQYLSNGDKIIKTNISLNGKTQSFKTQVIHLNNSCETSIYDGTNLKLTQKDSVSVDGKIKSAIYDSAKNRISRVINKDATGNILLRNEYTYSATGKVDYINCFDNNNKLTQYIKYTSDGGKIITNYDGNGTAKDVTTYDKDGNVTEIQ